MKIALVANTSWYLYNFRRNLMSTLASSGHQVIAIGSTDGYAQKLESEGFSQRTVPFNQAGVNPLRELQTVRALEHLLDEEDIDVVLSWTPKGNIYAALALMRNKKPLIANVSGLGRAFIHRTWVTLVVRHLLKFALGRASFVFFQNADDRQQFTEQGLVEKRRSLLLPGSGVDLNHFSPLPPRALDNRLQVLMVSRLLWSKGIIEFIEAARTLRGNDSNWRFQVLGAPDESGSSGVPPSMLQSWVSEGVIEYLGTTDDVRGFIAAADCIVLPSYREGLPRSMLEGAAMARPILTTDAPGCRDCVDNGVNGFLFRPQDTQDLISALKKFKCLDNQARIAMGEAGRRKVETQFDERIVIDRYLSAINRL
jgi:glycosyltransferase involved in cell wall biosynthesis